MTRAETLGTASSNSARRRERPRFAPRDRRLRGARGAAPGRDPSRLAFRRPRRLTDRSSSGRFRKRAETTAKERKANQLGDDAALCLPTRSILGAREIGAPMNWHATPGRSLADQFGSGRSTWRPGRPLPDRPARGSSRWHGRLRPFETWFLQDIAWRPTQVRPWRDRLIKLENLHTIYAEQPWFGDILHCAHRENERSISIAIGQKT
jgi:hypothetical protein